MQWRRREQQLGTSLSTLMMKTQSSQHLYTLGMATDTKERHGREVGELIKRRGRSLGLPLTLFFMLNMII